MYLVVLQVVTLLRYDTIFYGLQTNSRYCSRTHPYDLADSCSLNGEGDNAPGEGQIAPKPSVFRTRFPQVSYLMEMVALKSCYFRQKPSFAFL
jgi:hypothetical protein